MKTTWPKALLWFFAPVVIVLGLRWAFFEPYVIPSGSMIPHLLIHDHILVNKWSYGLRLPFSEKWLWIWNQPLRGDIVVFKYPVDKKTFFVKRIVALAGDTIEVKNGTLYVNGAEVKRTPTTYETEESENDLFDYFEEKLGEHDFISRSSKMYTTAPYGPVKVPEGHFFVVGDNRDQSSDSRVWGFVPSENLMGKANLIWLSCENTLPSAPMVCDPKTMRWNRIFKKI